jgi:hypothetical protein
MNTPDQDCRLGRRIRQHARDACQHRDHERERADRVDELDIVELIQYPD